MDQRRGRGWLLRPGARLLRRLRRRDRRPSPPSGDRLRGSAAQRCDRAAGVGGLPPNDWADEDDPEYIVDGSWDSRRESDGVAFCDRCDAMLGYSLTRCGLEREVDD